MKSLLLYTNQSCYLLICQGSREDEWETASCTRMYCLVDYYSLASFHCARSENIEFCKSTCGWQDANQAYDDDHIHIHSEHNGIVDVASPWSTFGRQEAIRREQYRVLLPHTLQYRDGSFKRAPLLGQVSIWFPKDSEDYPFMCRSKLCN